MAIDKKKIEEFLKLKNSLTEDELKEISATTRKQALEATRKKKEAEFDKLFAKYRSLRNRLDAAIAAKKEFEASIGEKKKKLSDTVNTLKIELNTKITSEHPELEKSIPKIYKIKKASDGKKSKTTLDNDKVKEQIKKLGSPNTSELIKALGTSANTFKSWFETNGKAAGIIKEEKGNSFIYKIS